MSRDFWAGRRVLVTGHTGFKGAWLTRWLQTLGAEVTGLALAPEPGGAFASLEPWNGLRSHLVDIRDRAGVAGTVAAADPEVVFHLAAQPLVLAGYADPVATYEVNVLGTANLLAALDGARSLRAAVAVTTDKVYAPGTGAPHREDDPLGGNDPYSASKACVEVLVRGWRAQAPAPVVTARAGNVLGGGDLAPHRLLPDTRRALLGGSVLRLRNPDAVRPWQFVLDPVAGYLALAERAALFPSSCPSAVNFGPGEHACIPVRAVVEKVFAEVGAGSWLPADAPGPPEVGALRVDSRLAAERLDWRPCLSVEEAIGWTAEWWRAEDRAAPLGAVVAEQLARYEGRRAP